MPREDTFRHLVCITCYTGCQGCLFCEGDGVADACDAFDVFDRHSAVASGCDVEANLGGNAVDVSVDLDLLAKACVVDAVGVERPRPHRRVGVDDVLVEHRASEFDRRAHVVTSTRTVSCS